MEDRSLRLDGLVAPVTGGGSVIVTSSVNGTRVFSNTGATAYASSKAGQVAELVRFLASDASSHITGTEVWIDGGESLLIG